MITITKDVREDVDGLIDTVSINNQLSQLKLADYSDQVRGLLFVVTCGNEVKDEVSYNPSSHILGIYRKVDVKVIKAMRHTDSGLFLRDFVFYHLHAVRGKSDLDLDHFRKDLAAIWSTRYITKRPQRGENLKNFCRLLITGAFARKSVST